MNKTSNEIRQMFISFFKKYNHKIITGSSLIPKNDSSLLFTNAGMNQFKDIFLGKNKKKYQQVATIQRCLRTGGKHNDLENVGYSDRHHTIFEMLGNFSFGTYFKKEAITYAWELLTSTQWYGIDKNRLWVTTHQNDQQTYDIWLNIIGIPKNKILIVENKKNSKFLSDNFWQMGETGPCGPSTEIFYDQSDNYLRNINLNIKKPITSQIEIWNIVFIEYNKTINGEIIPLSTLSVDTGMGLERITRILQDKKSNYEIDIFNPIINEIKRFNKNITTVINNQPYNIIADHIRSSCFLISENILPSNEGRGYVLRRIIRRALRVAHTSGMNKMFFYKLVPALIESLHEEKKTFKNIEKMIQEILKNEEIQFNETIKKGIKLLEHNISINKEKNCISGKTAFKLYDTFGFPIDLTKDFCKEKNLKLDNIGFEKEMQKQKKMSQKNKKFKNDYNHYINLKIKSKFEGYSKSNTVTKVTKILINGMDKNEIDIGKQGVIFLKNTTFFPESSGQIGDSGKLISSSQETIFIVENTIKYGLSIGHVGIMISGKIQLEQEIIAKIDVKRRNLIQKNHTATHLLHATLIKFFGKNTIQKGSLITNNYLRFDFLINKKINPETKKKIERTINFYISNNIPIKASLDSLENSKKIGALTLPNKKYEKMVRIISINNISIELCSGTHTKYTGDIGLFKIISEKNIGFNIRRIEAVTGNKAIKFIHKKEDEIFKISNLLQINDSHLLESIKKLIQEKKISEEQVTKFQEQEIFQLVIKLKNESKKINNIHILIKHVDNYTQKTLRILFNKLKKNFDLYIIILISVIRYKTYFIIGVSKKLTNTITAIKIMDFIKMYINGKGGGKDHLTEGFGNIKNQKLLTFLHKVESWIHKSIRN